MRFPLHPLLRRLYTEVGNGGRGPEYGAAGLIGGSRPDLPSQGSVASYCAMRMPDPDDPSWPGWPFGLFPAANRGCAIWSCVDCTTDEGQVVRFDPNVVGAIPEERWKGIWLPERLSLADWLNAKLEQRLLFELPVSNS